MHNLHKTVLWNRTTSPLKNQSTPVTAFDSRFFIVITHFSYKSLRCRVSMSIPKKAYVSTNLDTTGVSIARRGISPTRKLDVTCRYLSRDYMRKNGFRTYACVTYPRFHRIRQHFIRKVRKRRVFIPCIASLVACSPRLAENV